MEKATYPDATIQFRASDMIMNVNYDASYLSESDARSRACGHFFMGWTPTDGDPIKLNDAFFTLCAILRFVLASAAESELGALFLNCKEGMIFLFIPRRVGPSPTKNTDPLQQRHSRRNCIQHRHTTTILFNGNETFLGL
jgi:hypothetical protein